jgi:hypothetical protein
VADRPGPEEAARGDRADAGDEVRAEAELRAEISRGRTLDRELAHDLGRPEPSATGAAERTPTRSAAARCSTRRATRSSSARPRPATPRRGPGSSRRVCR